MPAPRDYHPPSADSVRPLIPASAQSSPRPRNVLLKRSSLRRQRSVSADGAIRHTTDQIRPTSDPTSQPYDPSPAQQVNQSRPESDWWSMVDRPPQPGGLGASMYNQDSIISDTADRGSSRQSMYMDVEDDHQPLRHLQLDAPMHSGQEATVPLRDVPAPNRAARVDVGVGIGIPSMHGSVGYLGRQSGMSGYTGSTPAGSELGRGLSDREVKGKGREVVTPEFGGQMSPAGVGSARTRISIGSS